MAAESCRKRLQEETSCSICLDYFADPVTLDCGHNFCRACIVKCWGESPTDGACPQCRERVQTSSLKPNRQLANMVELVKELSDLPRQEAAAGRETCERHQEPLKLFCQDDEAPICVVCDRSKEHRAHRVVPAEEAAQEYKDQISHSLALLRKERENILLYKAENEKGGQDMLKQTEAEKEKIAAAFRQLRQFLDEQEKLLLARTEEVEKAVARRRDEHLARLSGKLASLDSLIREMEEKQQQSASELLQDIGDILKRCKKKPLKNPVAFPAALRLLIHEFCDLSHVLELLVKQFQDTLVNFNVLPQHPKLQEADVTLDPDTAHPQLVLTEDRKSVRGGRKRHDLPNNPERFEKWSFVLGREGFTTGRHFWEVSVSSGANWAVGVARKSVRRKSYVDVGPEEGVWAVGKRRGEYSVLNPPDYTPLSPSGKLNRIRVTLNCDKGQVDFFNADTMHTLLFYAYSAASFSGETILPFFYVTGKNTHLTLSLPEPESGETDVLPNELVLRGN